MSDHRKECSNEHDTKADQSLIGSVSDQCKNLIIQSVSEDIANKVSVKQVPKNAKKKKLKLQMQMSQVKPQVNGLVAQTKDEQQASSTSPVDSPQLPTSSVHDFFIQHIGPLYANTKSRYLENLSYHPQYQYMQCNQIGDMHHNNVPHAVSLPNTPTAPLQQVSNRISIPNSPQPQQTDPTSYRYFQNALNHPLLSKSLGNEKKNVDYQNLSNTKSPKKMFQQRKSKSKKNKGIADDKKFDPYFNAREVEAGLKNYTLIEGVLRINPKQFQHSYVSSIDRNEQDVLIDSVKNRNKALEGDYVVVQLLSESDSEEDGNNKNKDKQKKGKVVFIKERNHTRTCIGTLKLMADKNRQKALFIPRDHRIPMLNIPFTCWPDNFYNESKAYENTLFLAKIVDWTDTRFAVGKIMYNIGQSGDMVTETKAILAQTDLDVTPYGQEVRHLFPKLDYTIPEEEINKREDCRELCLFSIDPNNCRDIDDAVSCVELENGNYEVGVHISDVTHFLTENTILDEKVAERATTIYLVEQAFHMLPDDLCMLCSLFPGVDKLAFSVFWEMTKDAQVINHRISKTVINSCCQLAYEHAQAILDDFNTIDLNDLDTYNGYEIENIKKSIKILGNLSRIMRRNRFEGGALRIDQPKINFRLNGSTGLPDSFLFYESQESHQLIEEFMLLANMTVAEKIYADYPQLAFLRCHPPPSSYLLQQLAKSLKPMGIELDVSSAGDLHRSLLTYIGPGNDDMKGRSMVLNMLCAKPMTRAKYFCASSCEESDFQHYALNVPLYTHFTSPIRRYADIMVHRLLAASIKWRDTPDWKVDNVRMIAAQCNKQKYNAKKAGELSTELYILKYIEMHSPVLTEAVVVEVREKYIDVIIVAMGLNRRIFLNNDFPGKFKCIKSDDNNAKLSKMELIWNATDSQPRTVQIINTFTVLQVEMYKGDEMVKVETKLVRPLPCDLVSN